MKQQPDGSIQMQFPTSPDLLIPHLTPSKDTGAWVRALLQLPPNLTLMAASEWLTWPDWIKTWGEVTGIKTSYKQTTIEDLDEHVPGGAGREIGEMFQFSSDFAYNAFQSDTLKTWDLEKVCMSLFRIVKGLMIMLDGDTCEDHESAGVCRK